MAGKYDEDVKLLEELAEESPEEDSSKVSMSMLFSQGRKPAQMGYDAAAGLVDSLALGKQVFRAAQPKAASPSLLQVGLEKSQAHEAEFMKQAQGVKAELQEIMNKMGSAGTSGEQGEARPGIGYVLRKLEVMGSKPLIIRKIRDEDLVLPKLSVTDQISELEKIIVGLKEGGFSQDQLEVVEEELYGLTRAVKRRGAQPVIAESNLISLRNQRLREATKELEAYLIRSGK